MQTKKASTNWQVITGGPSTGKTTVINMLAERGYKTTIEHARHYIDTMRTEGQTVEELRSNQLWKEPIAANPNFLIFKTINIFETMKTLMTSNTTTNSSGIRDSTPRILDRLKRLVGPEFLIILFVSGGHGQDGESGFTRRKLLDKKFYEQTCKEVGVEPQNAPSATIQPVYIDAHKKALLKNSLTDVFVYNTSDALFFSIYTM